MLKWKTQALYCKMGHHLSIMLMKLTSLAGAFPSLCISSGPILPLQKRRRRKKIHAATLISEKSFQWNFNLCHLPSADKYLAFVLGLHIKIPIFFLMSPASKLKPLDDHTNTPDRKEEKHHRKELMIIGPSLGEKRAISISHCFPSSYVKGIWMTFTILPNDMVPHSWGKLSSWSPC